jgi:hypothetical protein
MPDELGFHQRVKMESDFRLREKEKERAEEFVEYVISEAGNTITEESFDTDIIRNAVYEIEMGGFRHDPEDAPVEAFFDSASYREVRSSLSPYQPLTDQEEYMEVTLNQYPSIPERTAIFVHPRAITPLLPGTTGRPWFVRKPEGVVVVQDSAAMYEDER